MVTEKEIVCGADIHRDFLLATMISRNGLKLQEQFDMDEDGLLSFRSWILGHKCQRVAVESTGNYWCPIFSILEGHVEFILANAFQIRNIEGKKTNRLDSERIAISSVISDSFGKSGSYIIEQLLEGKTIEQIQSKFFG